MSDPVLNSILENNNKVELFKKADNQISVALQKMVDFESFEKELESKKERLSALKSEVASCNSYISRLNSIDEELRISTRLSGILQQKYDTPADNDDYSGVMLREGYVQGVVNFRKRFDSIADEIIDYRKFGYTVGVNALSFSLAEWCDAIKSNKVNAVLFSRILSTHDACVRQFFEPQMVVNYLLKDLPERAELFQILKCLGDNKTGDDFDSWRKDRSMSILSSITDASFDEENRLQIANNPKKLSEPLDLIGNLPDFSIASVILNKKNPSDRFNFHINSPLGLYETFGFSVNDNLLDDYPLRFDNIDKDLLAMLSESESAMKMEK